MHEIERLLITSFLPRLSLPQMQLRWQAVGKLSLYLSEVSHGEHMPAALPKFILCSLCIDTATCSLCPLQLISFIFFF